MKKKKLKVKIKDPSFQITCLVRQGAANNMLWITRLHLFTGIQFSILMFRFFGSDCLLKCVCCCHNGANCATHVVVCSINNIYILIKVIIFYYYVIITELGNMLHPEV